MAFLKDLQKDFKKLVDNGRLSHSYIFFGPDVESQFLFAKSVAGYLEKGEWDYAGLCLDANFFNAEKDSGIDAVREMTRFLWQRPVVSKRRLLIVHQASKLTLAAQNAILKIAEEPPEHGLLILIANDPESLIAPLISRFQKFYFSDSGDVLDRIKILAPAAARDAVNQILTANSQKEKSEIIKSVVEQELVDVFFALLVGELRKSLLVNWRILRSLMYRWRVINQFNVNKKLQLEAALFN